MRNTRQVRFALASLLFFPVLLIATLFLISGCGTPASRLPMYSGVEEIRKGSPGYSNTLQVQYLGVGGLLFRRGDDVVMSPPFYSNPNPLRFLPFVTTRPNTNQIEDHLPDVSDAAAIVVGHAHYDHLMDLPYIAKNQATNAVVLGSTSAINVLSACLPPGRLRAITNDAGLFQSGGRTGVWHRFRSDSVRIMALESSHTPQIGRLNLFEGEIAEPLKKLPAHLTEWKGGRALAYVIDFLVNGEIDYRIVYQDSAVDSPPFGGMPHGLQGDRAPDVLIVSVGSFKNARNYPMGVIDAWKPRNIIAVHWENFFRRYPQDLKDLRALPRTDVSAFMQNLTLRYSNQPAYLTWPGAWIRIERVD